jgi:hypothetical protein
VARHRLGGTKRYAKCNIEEKGARKKDARTTFRIKFVAALRAAPQKTEKQ